MKKLFKNWYQYEFPWDRGEWAWEVAGERYWGNEFNIPENEFDIRWQPELKARRTAYKKILEIQKKIDAYNEP